MKIDHDYYNSAVSTRYANKEMSRIFSDQYRYSMWRRLWVNLAERERELGVGITEEQIKEMRQHINDIDFERVAEIESETHHDVMAHIKAYAEQCPKAAPIIHLGATSCYVTDNTDVILMYDAMDIICEKLEKLIDSLCDFAEHYAGVETIGYTHFQPAQPTTIGKRATLWIQDFMIDLYNMKYQSNGIKLLGCRGATGTMESFTWLLDNMNKVREIENRCVELPGIPTDVIPVSGQTYTRKQDFYVLQVLSGIAQSASKMATDIRLLSHTGEVREGFKDKQVGSSAMPYKRNPISCENVCSLSRYIMCDLQNAAITASSQWLERSLDDSANRRLLIPDMFILTDSVLGTCISIVNSLTINHKTIGQNIFNNAHNASVESVLMTAVLRGGNRQKLHEKLKDIYSRSNRMESIIRNISTDPEFRMSEDEVINMMYAWHGGTAERQTTEFVDAIRNELSG